MKTKIMISALLVMVIAAVSFWLVWQPSPDTQPSDVLESSQLSSPVISTLEPQAAGTEASAEMDTQEAASTDTATEPTQAPEAPSTPAVVLPPLDDSDAAFVSLAQRLSPKFVAWLLPDHQVRKWVTFVHNIADSKVPAQDRPIHYPIGDFKVDDVFDSFEVEQYFSQRNYQRADALIQALTHIPAQKLVASYQQWSDLFEEAFADLGLEQSFHERLIIALDNIVAVDPLEQPLIALTQPAVHYKYRDAQLENSDALTKLMWRIGPENMHQLQDYATQVRDLLHSPE